MFFQPIGERGCCGCCTERLSWCVAPATIELRRLTIGKFKLVDVLDQLPELKRRPGLTKWKVATQTSSSEGKKLVWHDTFEEYEKVYEEQFGAADEKDKDKKRPLPSTAWPPANATELGLEHW